MHEQGDRHVEMRAGAHGTYIECRSPMSRRGLLVLRPAAVLLMALFLPGCVPVAITALGVGMATGVSHTLGGIVYKTFTSPQANVKKAAMNALNRMQIKVVETKRDGTTEIIKARAADRDIEIELESLSGTATRMAVTARKDGGILRDGATATEIILQTEKIVGPT